MIPNNPGIEFLYSFEREADYAKSCQYLFDKYLPQNEMEVQIVSHIAVATWLRRRYAATMHHILRQLEAARQEAMAGEAQIVQLTRSLVRFNREYRHQKKHISGCRAALKRLRQVEGEAGRDAAVLAFPELREEVLFDEHSDYAQAA